MVEGKEEEEENPAARDLDPTFLKVCTRGTRSGCSWNEERERERRVKKGCPRGKERVWDARLERRQIISAKDT